MIEEFTRPLTPEERAELQSLVEDVPRPWHNALISVLIVVASVLISLGMLVVIRMIMRSGWSEMVVGTVSIVPGVIALLSTFLALFLLRALPGTFRRDVERRAHSLAEAPKLKTVLEENAVQVVRVRATGVIELLLSEGYSPIYLFELPSGSTYYYESSVEEVGPWPNHSFEIVRGIVADEEVWKRVYGTGALLEASQRIEEPWRYNGFEAFIEREEGDEAFADGAYSESPESLLSRMIGTR